MVSGMVVEQHKVIAIDLIIALKFETEKRAANELHIISENVF